jgi:hypothetical protein
MRAMRRAGITTGLLILAMLPAAAAVPVQPATSPQVPVAIAQPLVTVGPFGRGAAPLLPESGLIALIGTGLFGLAAIVRKTTKT